MSIRLCFSTLTNPDRIQLSFDIPQEFLEFKIVSNRIGIAFTRRFLALRR